MGGLRQSSQTVLHALGMQTLIKLWIQYRKEHCKLNYVYLASCMV